MLILLKNSEISLMDMFDVGTDYRRFIHMYIYKYHIVYDLFWSCIVPNPINIDLKLDLNACHHITKYGFL